MAETASRPRLHPAAGLALFVAACVAVALVGSLAAASAGQDYQALERPAWAPPPWLFGPVWTVLYGLIAVSGWLVWRQGGARRELTLYGVQLVLNAAWTPLFFAAKAYELALVDILLLLAAIVVLIVWFRRKNRLASLLLVPYLLWVAFATALTIAIVVLN